MNQVDEAWNGLRVCIIYISRLLIPNLSLSLAIKGLLRLNIQDPFRDGGGGVLKKKQPEDLQDFKLEKTKYKHETKTVLKTIY